MIPITRISIASGIKRTMYLDITDEQILQIQKGGFVQDVLKHLTDDEREFFLTGMTPEEWDAELKEME